MSVVALSYAYPPLRYPRAIQVARLVAHMDGDVRVVCAHEEGAAHDESLQRAYGDAVPVTRVPWSTRARLVRKVRARVLEDRALAPDVFRPWVGDAVRATVPLLGDGDVLVTFGQPMSDHLAGLRLARRTHVAWVAHFSDPWVDSAFRHAGRAVRALNARLERAVIARADAVVFTSQATVDLVMAKYPDAWRERVHVVPHAFDPALYGDAAAGGDEVVLRYIGNFYGHRGPGPLFAAIAALHAREPGLLDRVVVEIVGSRETPIEVPAGVPDGLVRLRDPVDYVDSLALMRASDVLLVVDAPAERSVFLPSKLIDYLGAGRPILALTPPGAAADLVRRAGGQVADPADAGACAAALAAVLRDRGAHAAPAGLLREFEAGAVAARMAGVVDAARASYLDRTT